MKKHWTFLGIALGFLTMAGLVSYFYSDIAVSRYGSYSEAKADHAFERGWLPKVVPPSAFDIFEKHNIDTNEVEGWFRYKNEDAQKVQQEINKGEQGYLFEVVPSQNLVRFRYIPSDSAKRR